MSSPGTRLVIRREEPLATAIARRIRAEIAAVCGQPPRRPR